MTAISIELGAFLEGVDDQRDDDLVTAAKAFVTATGLKSTKELGSAAMSDLEGVDKWKDLDLRVRGFVRRAVTLAAEVARIKTAGPSQGAQSSDTQQTGLMTQLMASGAEISAQLVANGLASASATVPIEILKRNGLQSLPFGNRPEAAVFQLLEAASKAAKAAQPPTQALTYVEFTAREMLPPWLTQDMLGGKVLMAGEVASGFGGEATITSLSAALKAASATPRFFRSFEQWSAVFWRYASVALPTGHWTLGQLLCYFGVIAQIAEQERVSKGYPYLAFVYDEIVRRSWSQRVIAGEKVDLDKETSTIDRTSLDFARTRLSMVLKHAGLESAATAVSAGAEVSQVAAESALAKQQAAAEALRRRAEQSARDLARNQQQFERGGKGDQSNKRKPTPREDRDGWFGSAKYGKSGKGKGKSSKDGGGGKWY